MCARAVLQVPMVHCLTLGKVLLGAEESTENMHAILCRELWVVTNGHKHRVALYGIRHSTIDGAFGC